MDTGEYVSFSKQDFSDFELRLGFLLEPSSLLLFTPLNPATSCPSCTQGFLEEVEQWKPCIDAVNESGERLIVDYNADDTNRIRQILDNVRDRWTVICDR